jgi:hypothetical protein
MPAPARAGGPDRGRAAAASGRPARRAQLRPPRDDRARRIGLVATGLGRCRGGPGPLPDAGDSRKARNIERDPRVALSIAHRDDPYREADLRGRVVERIDGDAALVLADRIALKYTGQEFPVRGEGTVVYVIEAIESRHVKLPFTDEG